MGWIGVATSPYAKAGRLPRGLSSQEIFQNHLNGRKANGRSNTGVCTLRYDVKTASCSTSYRTAVNEYCEGDIAVVSPGVARRFCRGLSRVRRKVHARFLGGWARATASGYPTGTSARISPPGSRGQLGISCGEPLRNARNRDPITAWGQQSGRRWPLG